MNFDLFKLLLKGLAMSATKETDVDVGVDVKKRTEVEVDTKVRSTACATGDNSTVVNVVTVVLTFKDIFDIVKDTLGQVDIGGFIQKAVDKAKKA